MFSQALRSSFDGIEGDPPLQLSEMSCNQTEYFMEALLLLFCIIIIMMIIFAPFLRPNIRQNTQKLLKKTSGYENQTRILINKCVSLKHYIFVKLEFKFQQFTHKLLSCLEFIYTMMIKRLVDTSFKLYSYVLLHNQLKKIQNYSIITLLKKLQIKSSQKIQQQKLQFIKNDKIIYSNNNDSTFQYRSLNMLALVKQVNNECLTLIKFIINNIKGNLINTKNLRYNTLNFVILLLLNQRLATQVSGQTQCNTFPKIFGGNNGNSFLHQIDVFNDYLVIAGDTHDHQLIGSSPNSPTAIIALSSISINSQYIWAKAFPQKPNLSFYGVQFSGDGELLIAHSGFSNQNIIVVMSVSTGHVLSARGYESYPLENKNNYNDLVKSILVSQGPSSMAYVLSDYTRTYLEYNTQNDQFYWQTIFRQIILKFNPLIFSQPEWAMKSIYYQTGHLGLEFGKSQQFLYAYSRQNDLSTISLLDANGNSYWQYGTSNGNQFKSNLIEYKEIDQSTDMVIATSSLSKIFFNRIISSSSHPYQVSSSQTFKDPASSSSKLIYGLYIKDQNNSVSLIYDSTTFFTDLAIINFEALSISYQKAFSKIENMVIAIFSSPTVYYAGGYSNKFVGLGNENWNLNGKSQSFVYSSEDTYSSCYSMEPLSVTSSQLMIILSSLNSLPSSIYQDINVTFENDIQAQNPVNIDQAKLSQIPYSQVCPLLRIKPVTQANHTFRFKANSDDQYLAITPFSVKAYCGEPDTWTYSGKNNTNGNALVQSTDLVSVDPISGTIFVSQFKPAGNYYVKVIGTLPDVSKTTFENFAIIINGPPIFASPPQNITVPLNTSFSNQFSTITDPNYGDILTISEVKDSATGQLPSFITFSMNSSSITINPTLMTHVKTYQMIVTITDTYDTTQYTFQINVTNKAPHLTSPINSPYNITFGQSTTYLLPSSNDPEQLPYTTSIIRGPTFASLFQQSQLILFPKLCTDFGSHNISILLQDEEPANTTYFIVFEVKNIRPPIFTSYLKQNQIAILKKKSKYELPPYTDPNGCSVQMKVEVQPEASFIYLQETELIYDPTQEYHLGIFQIKIILIGIQDIQSVYQFDLTVHEPPKFYRILQKQLDLIALSSLNFSLPVLDNVPEENVVHPSGLPNFVKFNFPVYTFQPKRSNDVGMFFIKGELQNKFASTKFQFKVYVTNNAPQLQFTKIPDIYVPQDTDYTFYFGDGTDRERQKIRYEANEKSKTTLPSFMTLEAAQRQLKIQPSKLVPLNDYHIELSLIDDFYARTTYSFVVKVIDPSNSTNQAKTKNPFQVGKSYQSARIKSISPYGVVVIKFSEELETPIYINNASLKFNASNMNVILKPFPDENQHNKNKSIARWDAINLTTSEMTIQVNFTDPALISPKITQEDTIEITFQDGKLFRSARGQKNLPDDYVMLTGLPRQIVITKQIQSLYDMVTSGSTTMTYLVVGNIALQLFLSFSMHLLWGMMNNLQLISMMLKFNIDVPSNAYIFFKYIDEFLSMKAQFIENYLEKFNSYIMKTTQGSGQSDKDSYTSIIKNLGTIILGSVAVVLAMILTAILIKYSRIPLVMKISNALKNKLFYNSILRTGVQSYLKFSIIAFASLDSYKDKTTLATGIFFLCATVFFIIFAHLFLRKNQPVLSDPNFQQRFNSLYLNIETDTLHSYFLTTIFLGRRFLLGIVLTFGENHQDAQFFFMNFSTFLIIIYLAKVRPLVSNYLNAIEIFNEVILYGCTGLIWGMTNYQSENPAGFSEEQIKSAFNSKQNQIGLAYIVMASLTIAVTIGGLVVNILAIIKNKIIQKYGNNKADKAPESEPQSLERRNDYKLQQYDDTTMIQNNSMLQDLNHEVIQQPKSNMMKKLQDSNNPFENQDHHNKQLQDHYLDNLPDHYNLDSQEMRKEEVNDQENEKMKKQAALMRPFNDFKEALSPQPPLIQEEEQRVYSESVFVSSSEFQSSLEESKEVYPVQYSPPSQLQADLPDVFVSSEEVQNIFQESNSLTPNDLWAANNSPVRRKVNIRKFS